MAGQYIPVLYDAFVCLYSVYEWKIMAEVDMYDHQEAALLHIQNYSTILYQLMLSYTISYSNVQLKIFMDYLPIWIATYRFESLSVFLLLLSVTTAFRLLLRAIRGVRDWTIWLIQFILFLLRGLIRNILGRPGQLIYRLLADHKPPHRYRKRCPLYDVVVL